MGLAACCSLFATARSASHSAAEGGAGDAGGEAGRPPTDGPAVPDAAAVSDAASRPDGGADGGLHRPVCRLTCEVRPQASGYARDLLPATHDVVEILAAEESADGSVHVLLSPSVALTRERTQRQWILATLAAGATTFDIEAPGRTWPSSPADLEGRGQGLTTAVLRASGSSVRAVVIYDDRPLPGDPSPQQVRAASMEWSPAGELLGAGPIGIVATIPALAEPRGTLFALPGGDVVAAVEQSGLLQATRIAWEPDVGAAAEIVERSALGHSDDSRGGTAALSGLALDDRRWLLAGGGRVGSSVRPAFVMGVEDGVLSWWERLPGAMSAPPPLLAAGAGGALALRWDQSPDDVDDSRVLVTRLTAAGSGATLGVVTPRLPLPMDAQVTRLGSEAVAVWSVRAPDILEDTLVHALVLDPGAECEATDAPAVVRLPGAASAPSVHVARVGDDLLVLGLPLTRGDRHSLAAFVARCAVSP